MVRHLRAAQPREAHILLAVDIFVSPRRQGPREAAVYHGKDALERCVGLLDVGAEYLGRELRAVCERRHAPVDAQHAAVKSQFVVRRQRFGYGPLLLRHLRLVLGAARFGGLLAPLPLAFETHALGEIGGAELVERIFVHRLETVDVVALGLVFASREVAQIFDGVDVVAVIAIVAHGETLAAATRAIGRIGVAHRGVSLGVESVMTVGPAAERLRPAAAHPHHAEPYALGARVGHELGHDAAVVALLGEHVAAIALGAQLETHGHDVVRLGPQAAVSVPPRVYVYESVVAGGDARRGEPASDGGFIRQQNLFEPNHRPYSFCSPLCRNSSV